MEKSFKKIFLSTIICISLALGWFFGFFLHAKPSAVAIMTQTSQVSTSQTNVSIFIRKPTYSVVYNGKIYFIDDGDKRLKIYNIDSDEFENTFVSLSDYSQIEDVCLCEDNLYLLVSQETFNKIVKIKLDSTLEKSEIHNFNINTIYNSFCVSNITFSDKIYTIFTFTTLEEDKKSSFAIFDNSEDNFITLAENKQILEIGFNNSGTDRGDYNTGIVKVIPYSNTSGNYLLFLYSNGIIGYKIENLESLKALASIQDIKLFTLNFTFLRNETITEAGVLSINDNNYLSIGYNIFNAGVSTECLRLYSIQISTSNNSISQEKEIDCINSNFSMFNENHFSYSSGSAQSLYFVDFSTDNSNISFERHEIANPNVNVTYLSANDFVYKTTNKQTKLFDNPWGATSNVVIDDSTDVIKIGSGFLRNNQEIADYDYCMFTNTNGNHFGFIARDDLDEKQEVSLESAGYRVITDENSNESYARVSIWQNSSLYSLPTTSESQRIGSSEVGFSDLVAEKLMKIPNNSEVFVLDCLCAYSSNGVKLLKVKINNQQIGYIEARCIRMPSDIVDFVITNATIKNDNTKVYLTANSDAPTLSFALNKGKNIRINGSRDTKTGFTSITFNDEFGNEFSGYIMTDYVKSDSWSTLQIVGCILIAINIGLLILIIIFKNNHLGSHGQKISEDEVITK